MRTIDMPVNIAVTCSTTAFGSARLTRGDRVRIKDGYDGAGQDALYVGKSTTEPDKVLLQGWCSPVLADAIEPYPYTREERIERAIEDYEGEIHRIDGTTIGLADDARAILRAILDAGV